MMTYKKAILAQKRYQHEKIQVGETTLGFFLNYVKHIIFFALIAFFLLPKWRDPLKSTCDFIATTWANAWFSNQHYSENTYNELHAAVSKLKCPKALQSFSKNWIKQPSVLDVPRSNMVAERAVKLMEELHNTCRTDKYLNSKFINSNSQM
jgi:hypothetical protein